MASFPSLIDNHECMTVAVVGPVSCGKTSLLSMMLNKLVGTISKQRATMTTTVYRETDAYDSKTYTEQVAKVQKMDEELRDNDDDTHTKLSANLAKAMHHNIVDIPRMSLFKRHANTKIQLVDIPGLNDSSTKELYFKHLEDIFQHLSVIMLVFDINGAMNTDDEMQILSKVVELAKQVYESTGLVQQLFVVANKCDEMTYDIANKQLSFTDAEDEQLYQQLVSKVDNVIGKENPALHWDMVRISAENSFIYNKCRSHANANPKKKTNSKKNNRKYSHFGFLTDSHSSADVNGLASQYEKKYKDKLGMSEQGKKWHRLNAAEQDAYLTNTLTPENIAKSLQESGYRTFQNQLDARLTVGQQCTYLLNNLRVCVKTLVASADPAAVFAYLSKKAWSHGWQVSESGEDDETSAALFLKNLLEVCAKYESVVSNFKQVVPTAFDTFSFVELLKPFFDGLEKEMAVSFTGLQAFCDTHVTSDGKIPDTIQTHEKTLSKVLLNLRIILCKSRCKAGGDVLGVIAMTIRVTSALLAYYTKIVGCKTVAHATVHDIVSYKITGVNSSGLRYPMVLQLFANETLGALPESLEGLLALSKTVVSYCEHYHESGILTEAQRNKCLADFILDLYRRTFTDDKAVGTKWGPYLHSAKLLVWDYVLGSHSHHSVVRERYETFHAHSILCASLANWSCNRLRSSELDIAPQHVSPRDTMEYVCAKWHYPDVFADIA